MTAIEQFLWGVGGSVAVEIITLYQVYHSRNIRFPERYRRKGFWLSLCFMFDRWRPSGSLRD